MRAALLFLIKDELLLLLCFIYQVNIALTELNIVLTELYTLQHEQNTIVITALPESASFAKKSF